MPGPTPVNGWRHGADAPDGQADLSLSNASEEFVVTLVRAEWNWIKEGTVKAEP